MEYSIYINQPKAMEWGLSMGEAILFSYLISSCSWMRELRNDTSYKWASNAKLAEELPLVCRHPGSARRHMASLEEKGLITRRIVGNKGYFAITDKGLEWKSVTLKPNESVCLDDQAEPNGLAKANESVRPRANESVRRSYKPSLSNKPDQKKRKRPSADFEEHVRQTYLDMLPEWPKAPKAGWEQSQACENLRKRWSADPRCHQRDFWVTFFETVRTFKWWMSGDDGKPIEQARLSWLLSPSKFKAVIDKALEIDQEAS